MRVPGLILMLLLVASPPNIVAQSTSADEVMKTLRKKFEDSGGLTATFRQSLDAEMSETTSVVEGTIILSGTRYRIETGDQIVMTDGETTWVYVPRDQQVIVNEFVDDDESFTPGHFLDDRADRYDVAFVEEQVPGKYVVRLTAKSPDTYIETATLWVDRTDYIVSRIDVVDVNASAIRFEMSAVELSPEIDDSIFTFVPADGVEIVDLR